MNGRKVLLALMIAGVIATLAVLSTSQSGQFESQGKGQKLKGVWISTSYVTIGGEELEIHGMMRFDPDGGFLMIDEMAPKQTTGFGEWTKTAEREYSWKMLKLECEEGGIGGWTWIGWIKSEGTLMFDNQMKEGYGKFFFEVYDTARKEVLFSGEGTIGLIPMQLF